MDHRWDPKPFRHDSTLDLDTLPSWLAGPVRDLIATSTDVRLYLQAPRELPATDDLERATHLMREGLRAAVVNAAGECICDDAFAGRDLIDPSCGYHATLPMADKDTAQRLVQALADAALLRTS